MTPKELLLGAIRREETPRVPWVPFAGVHAGKLIGRDATEVLTDADLLFESLMKVNELYSPCGQPVLFDLQLEAECLGCELSWAKDSPPSVRTHPLEGEPHVPCDCEIPGEGSGRIPLALDAMRRMKRAVGERTALFGLLCGPFTLASHLRGNDIFTDMFDDGEYVERLLGFCLKVSKRMADMYIDAGMDVIAAVDPLISQISSRHFDEYMLGPFAELFARIRGRGALSAFFVCGDATRNIPSMCLAAPDMISVDENVDLAAAKAIADGHGIAMGGNLPLATVMLYGSQMDNMKGVIDLLDSVADRRGLIVAPGCDMPYGVPVENAIGAAQALEDEAAAREMLKSYVAAEGDESVELPDYASLPRPLIEVFTLDSATCAACTYMMGAASDAKARYGGAIDVIEYKYTVRESIPRVRKMGVPNLPSMYISGELKFRSVIPGREELDAAIEAAIGAAR